MWWNIQLLPEVRATSSLKKNFHKKNQLTSFVWVFFPSKCFPPAYILTALVLIGIPISTQQKNTLTAPWCGPAEAMKMPQGLECHIYGDES